MMDEIIRYNQERWNDLARNRVEYSRPMLKLDRAAAHRVVDPYGVLGEVDGKDVLCLAGGGGQQSAAFGLLGANVTVLDLSEIQLARDQDAAQHYGLPVRTVQGDMRDLSPFGEASFDVVWHAHSINFVPDAPQVFREVRHVLRPGGLYHLDFHNPFNHGLDERDWTGEGFVLKLPYFEGEVPFADPYWEVEDDQGKRVRVLGPREFRHKLSTILNGLIELGFGILGFWEEPRVAGQPAPGTWDHFLQVAPPYCALIARYHGEPPAGYPHETSR